MVDFQLWPMAHQMIHVAMLEIFIAPEGGRRAAQFISKALWCQRLRRPGRGM